MKLFKKFFSEALLHSILLRALVVLGKISRLSYENGEFRPALFVVQSLTRPAFLYKFFLEVTFVVF